MCGCCMLRIKISDSGAIEVYDYDKKKTAYYCQVTSIEKCYITFDGKYKVDKKCITNYQGDEFYEALSSCDPSAPQMQFEKCFPFNIIIQDGECITLQDVLDKFPAGKGIAGYDIDLKHLNGDGRDGFKASTSDATMEGPHGEGNLDGGGGFDIKPERLPDNTYNRLDLTQKFCSCEGSVLNLGISIIL